MAGRGRGKALTRPAWMNDQHLAPTVSAPSKESTTTDWARATAADGRPYWYSLSTGETTWEDPVQNIEKPPSAMAATPSVAAASSWRKHADEDGRIYYYNESTKQTQWEPPPGFLDSTPTVPRSKELQNGGQEKPTSVSASRVVLPEGWAESRTIDGRVYYYHAATRDTRWEAPTAGAPGNEVQAFVEKKRSASEMRAVRHDVVVPEILPAIEGTEDLQSQWKEHTTSSGKTYYYNTSTRETSWTRPSNAVTNGDAERANQKRPRLHAAVTDLRQLVPRASNKLATPVDKSKPKGHVVRRPRAPDGKALTDHQAESYFLKRSEMRRAAKSAEDKPERRDATLADLGSEGERQAQFHAMLQHRGVTAKSSWLETMSRCCADERYLLVGPYGKRKHEWLKFTEKLVKRQRRKSIVEVRESSEAFLALMSEAFVNEPMSSSSLDRCRPDAVKRFESDSRYQSIDERKRAALIRSFFAVRMRKGEREKAQKRKDALSRMRDRLNKMIDPALTVTNDKSNGKVDVTASKDTPDTNGMKSVSDLDTPRTRFFSDATPFRELQQFLDSVPDSEAVSGNEKSDIIRDWRRAVERLTLEKKAREREARKALLKDRRASFRSGVEKMLLDGHIPIDARWKDVSDVVKKESFFFPEEELDARPADLFEDGVELFDEKVQQHRDEFKQALKDSEIDVRDTTTLKELAQDERVGKLIKSMEKSVAAALLIDRQRRESKRRAKELCRAQEDFDELLRRSDVEFDATYETTIEGLKERSSYKQLLSLAGDTEVRKVFNDYLVWRKAKDETRQKRKFENISDVPFDHAALAALERAKRVRLPGGSIPQYPYGAPPIHPPRPVPVPVVMAPVVPAPPVPVVEEENGWTAALSSKPMTAKEKSEAKERRKRELLEGLNGGGHSVVNPKPSPK